MAFFKFGKKKKEDGLDAPMQPLDVQEPVQSLPVEQVAMMKQQGYTSNQIVQMLQSQGYNMSQINDAISQAGLGENYQKMPEQMETPMPEFGQAEPYQQPLQGYQSPPEMQQAASIDEERIQEITEAIIDEKWEEFAGNLKKIIEWKEKIEERVAKIEQQIVDARLSIDSLTKSMISKISAYDQNIVDVGTEVKAMEKVFQKVLPTLTESVNKLDRMTKGVKEKESEKNKS